MHVSSRAWTKTEICLPLRISRQKLDAHEKLKQIFIIGFGRTRNEGQKLVFCMKNVRAERGRSAVCGCERGNPRHSKDPLAIFCMMRSSRTWCSSEFWSCWFRPRGMYDHKVGMCSCLLLIIEHPRNTFPRLKNYSWAQTRSMVLLFSGFLTMSVHI